MVRENKGITLAILIVTIVVMFILTGTVVIRIQNYLEEKELIDMKNDIEILQEKIPIFSEQYNGSLPIIGEKLDNSIIERFSNIKNINDNSNYYKVNLDFFQDLQLNYGTGTEGDEDYYIVNEGSLAVYYLKGIEGDNKVYYTIEQNNVNIPTRIDAPDDFEINAVTTSNSITVNPSPIPKNVVKYRFRINNEEWIEQVENSYTFNNLNSNTTYKVSIQAIDSANGMSMASSKSVRTVDTSIVLAKNVLTIDVEATEDEKKSPYVYYVDNNNNNILCRVLYNDEQYGLQLVTVEPITKVILAKDDVTQSQEAYNSAITTLNNYAMEYLNTNLAFDARCIGSVPDNKNYPENLTDPSEIQSNMYSSVRTEMESYNGKYWATDNNYTTDIERLTEINAANFTDSSYGSAYWLASHLTLYSSSQKTTTFQIRRKIKDSTTIGSIDLWKVDEDGNAINSGKNGYGLRPVFSIKENVGIKRGKGTLAEPYELEVNNL